MKFKPGDYVLVFRDDSNSSDKQLGIIVEQHITNPEFWVVAMIPTGKRIDGSISVGVIHAYPSIIKESAIIGIDEILGALAER